MTQLSLVSRRPKSLDVLRQRASDCHRCPLHQTRTRVVFGTGNQGFGGAIDPQGGPLTEEEKTDRLVKQDGIYKGPQRVPVAVVGEAPGAAEDMRGEPFVGPSGELLTRMIESMGYERSEFYLCNTVCCRPLDEEGQNRPPTEKESAACRLFLEGQIRAVRPRVILALGASAARSLIKTQAPVSRLRGRWWYWRDGEDEYPVMITYHPAALLRDSSLKARAWKDLKEVVRYLKPHKAR